ncbi:MAG TPA: 4-(cytidine 5'-diphospho)-2-C-methyl-D-erythritol kinase [Candidatus Corynebacterium avicola]|uniref:4-diphosphocytidyl-2-C-methyl-D-erythritol kinase n=1 Tax=Candidatus Corynebacterium avicola TaxID=2838527 RepID=A0A9D1UKF9_9CORY|nr:4-(cytidine 5'-diphospho)-2-C-methyl-D-erythritol kinase [Candidatus Corynebacterium avicola]
MSLPDLAEYTFSSYEVSATAQGKVNLHLSVGDVREDGYHDLETVFHAVDLTDTVTVAVSGPVGGEPGGRVRLGSVTGRDAGNALVEGNPAVRAAELVVERYIRFVPDAPVPALSVSIDKQVPVAGGMASGAADAAASLLATAELLHGPRAAARGLDQAPAPSTEELHEMAAGLGAEVAFCLQGGTALGRGYGEEVVQVMIRGRYHWALVMDPRGLSADEVFDRLDSQRDAAARGERPDVRAPGPEEVQRALLAGDADVLGEHLRQAVNDLQAPAISLRPELRGILAAGKDAGALACVVAGSGPTVAMLCRDHAQAVDVATTLASEGVGGRAVATTTATSCPHGARLVD